MQPIELATLAVGFIAPYFAKGGEAVAKKVGEAAWDKIETVYTNIKNKLADDAYAKKTLKRVEDEPESETRQAALVGVLVDTLKADPTFAETLEKLLDEGKEKVVNKTISQTVNVSGSAKTGDIHQIGEAGGDVNIKKN